MRPFKTLLTRTIKLAICGLLMVSGAQAAEKISLNQIGAAKIDVTPDYPIRLNGYGGRQKESEGIDQRLFAKALAVGSDKDGPAILVTVDNLAVPAYLRAEVVSRLAQKAHIRDERFTICSTHTHTAPMLHNVCPTIFGFDIPPEQQERIDRYTRELTDKIEQVALEALKSRAAGTLSWGQTDVGFATNRRTKGGPVDHDLPVLVARDKKGNVRAILVSYACHCTTLSDAPNYICGDWAGYAQEYLERDFPGAIALVALGCAGDANPAPRTGLELAKQHGQEMTSAVQALLSHPLVPLHQRLECRSKTIALPFDTIPGREEWEKRAQSQNHWIAYHAKKNLARLDRGEKLPTELPYQVQTWVFGEQLGMVFLPGEVVVDYSLRLKREYDAPRLWVTAYANDEPCYIPSRRIWNEGGYEGGDAMIYYDRPTRLSEGTEDLIMAAVHDLLPAAFISKNQTKQGGTATSIVESSEFPPPLSARESLAAMTTKPGLEIELVAAEPLIVDPVAIDWGPGGKLWVVEMRDYPMGMDGHWKPGSRIKYLESTHKDGKYDKATVFLDNLPFATGVTAWRKGVLVCTAPDILYAEDTNGDGSADVVKKLFTGFYTDNYQARVNSLGLGLDNWIYGANGLLGGTIHGVSGAESGNPIVVDIRGRDFRMDPDTGAFEPASGLTQQGRVRDDWGNWFGCDNSTIAWHYPLPDQYIRRNPYVPAPSPRVSIAAGDDPNLLHPRSRTLERFNDPQSANRVTSGCGLGIYRDDFLGQEFLGNAFLCEPVHNLVHRLILTPNGETFAGRRAADEQQTEFLASRDNWFRPVQARTGPDGALYVVDMYRFVIEHPRWIPADRLAKLDVRAGDDKGRIYRVYPKGKKLRPIPDLNEKAADKLIAALDTPNGTERDRIHLALLHRVQATGSARSEQKKRLEELALKSQRPAVRLQALCVLDGLHELAPPVLESALADSNPAVRANAIRLSEAVINSNAAIASSVLKLLDDNDPSVRLQLAFSLAELNDDRATSALGKLAIGAQDDVWLGAAVLSSATRHPEEILRMVMSSDAKQRGRTEVINQLIATAAGQGNTESISQIVALIVPSTVHDPEPWRLAALNSLLDALERKHIQPGAPGFFDKGDAKNRLNQLFDWATRMASDSTAADSTRELAIHLLGRRADRVEEDLKTLVNLVHSSASAPVKNAAFDKLKRNPSLQVSTLLLADWKTATPSFRQPSIEVLLARDEWRSDLMNALESGLVARSEISPANRQRLLKDSRSQIQQRAQALWQESGSNSRAAVLTKYQSVTTMTGDSARGSGIFGNTCATCHFLRGQGFNVGPNLAPLSDKSPSDFLTAILDPNAAVEPRFVAYNIETKDRRSLSGIVSAETATTLTLVQAGGAQEKLLRNDIQEIHASGLSLMPEGLEQNLSPQDLADLIAFLKTSPRAFGSASPEQAEAAKKAFLAVGINGLARVISAFDKLPYGSWMGQLPMPYCRQTDGTAKVVWETEPAPGDLKADARQQFRLPVAMGLISAPSGKFELRLNGKLLLNFDVALTDQSWQSAESQARMNYTVMENNSEDSNGVLLIEVPGSLLEPGKPARFEVLGSRTDSQRWFGIYEVVPPNAAAKR
jgi:putative membrane-bound dehydrogenase-like protein